MPPRFACLATMRLPDELNLLIPYDVAVAVYLGLFCMLMERTSPEDAAEITWRGEPNDRRVQTYSYGALSAYAQVATSDQQFIFAGGFQSATNVAGNARRAGSRPGSTRISSSASGCPTASLLTVRPRYRSSQATASAYRSTRFRISRGNGASS